MDNLVLDRRLLGEPREKYWLTHIKRRIAKNKNFMAFCSGPTGAGKSYSCLSIASDLDPEFNIDRCVFSGTELLRLINSGKLHSGSAVVFEEVGVEFGSRTWQSTSNKLLSFLTQTFRNLNLILLCNSPYLDFADPHVRRLFHAEFAVLGIDYKTSECRLKPLKLQFNSRLGKFYYHRLRVVTADAVVPVNFWRVHRPNEELVKVYEAKKKAYTEALNARIFAELQKIEVKNAPKARRPLSPRESEFFEVYKRVGDVSAAVSAFGTSLTNARRLLASIRRKGWAGV